MVWGKTSLIGCAASSYEVLKGKSIRKSVLLVCDYGEAGNVIGEKFYETQ